MRKILSVVAVVLFSLTLVAPVFAASLGPGHYGAPDPNITYTHITGIGYHDSGNPFYVFDSATWTVVGADRMDIYKSVFGGGGTLCMDGTVCQNFSFNTTFLTMNLPDRGVHTFTMTNGIITFIDVLYDGTPPVTTASPTGALGNNGWYRSPITVSLSATDPTGAFPSTIVSGVASTTANSNPYSSPLTLNTEGANTLTYFSTDNKGNVETTHSLPINIDTQPPVTTASLTGSLGDNGWYISSVLVTLNGSDTTSGLAGTTFDSGVYSGPVTVSAQGVTSHTFFSSDVAGNIESAQTTSVNVDTDPPSASLASHTSGQIVRGLITLSGVASDVTSGIARVQVSTDGGTTWNEAALSSGAWSFPFDTTTAVDGLITVQASVRDLAGNEQTFASIGLTVDNTAPIVTFTTPDTDLCLGCGLDNSIPLDYSATDGTTGIANWTLSVEGGPTLATGSGDVTDTFAWDGAGLPLGPQTLRFTATDAAGNVQELATTVTLYAPSRTVTSQPIAFPVTALTGATQVVEANTPTTPWTAFNSFPSGTGWHIQIVAADFVAGARLIPANQIALRIQPSDILPQSGASTNPTSLVSSFTPLSNATQTILMASNAEGIGTYTFIPEFRLTVPAEAYAGEYTAIITLTILAGP